MNLIPFEPVPEGSSPEIREANARKMTFTKNQALKDIAPDSGAYFNEVKLYLRSLGDMEADKEQCDVNDPNWKQTTFGQNYERLAAVKRLYDPDGLMWCRNCVGSDQWEEQLDGGLCQSMTWEVAGPEDGDDDDLRV